MPLSCRFYSQKYPEGEDVVMVKVQSITEMGAYVSLLEYNNIEGMILFHELRGRQIKRSIINKRFRVGQDMCVVVLLVDKVKGYIDLSNRRVSPGDIEKCKEKCAKARAVNNLLCHVAEILKYETDEELENLYKKTVWCVDEKFKKHATSCDIFKHAVNIHSSLLLICDPSILDESDLDPEMKETLLTNIKLRVTPQAVRIGADIKVACYGYEGIDPVKNVLKSGINCSTEEIAVKINLIAPPLDVFKTTTMEKAEGLKALQDAIAEIETTIKASDGVSNIKCCNDRKWTVLLFVPRNGWRDVLESLCDKGAYLNAQTANDGTPLMISSDYSHKDIEFLISLGANTDCYDKRNWTVLHHVSLKGWLDIVQCLVLNGADPIAKTSRGCTPLFFASCRHKDVFELLIDSGTNVNCCDDGGWTVLHYISSHGLTDAAGSLFKKGADLNVKTPEEKTPMLLAAEHSHKALVQELIHLGANVNCCDAENWSVLHHAAREEWLDVVQSLVKNGADPDAKTSCGHTPLLIAAKNSHRETVEMLCDLTTDFECCPGDNKWTVLHYASSYGWLTVVNSLMKQGTKLNVKDSQGLTPLLIATIAQHESIIELLIDSEANLNCCDKNNKTVLHHAANFGWLGIAESIVKRGVDLDVKTNTGKTALLLAAAHGYTDIVSLLINAGANLECYGSRNWTVLCYALNNEWLKIMKCLAKKKVDFNLETPSGEIPILIAAKYSRKKVVQLLIKWGVNVDCYDDQKWTVLHYASFYKWLDVVQSVVGRGCDVNAQTSSGDTPVHLACNFSRTIITEHSINSCLEVVDLLMKRGAEINFRNIEGETPLFSASKSIYFDRHIPFLFKYLFRAGADCNLKNNYNDTPLFSVIWTGNIEIIKSFIENGGFTDDKTYNYFFGNSSLKEGILQDVKVCSQVVINKFNNKDLPTLYKLDVFPYTLPPIDKMKIADNRGIAQEIANTIRQEIQTKGYCNLMEVSPIVLSVLSLKSIIDCYNKQCN